MRPYGLIAEKIVNWPVDRTLAMQGFVDLLWGPMHVAGVSWLGFYLDDGKGSLILGPRRDKPACSPIGLHGACGRAFLSRKSLVVRDVAELGANYIACDPLDKSEVVVPLIERDGSSWGVLDLDSFDVGAFDENDVVGLSMLLAKAGLSFPTPV